MTTWRITKFDSPYVVSVSGPDTGGVEVGPMTRALKAEARVAELEAQLEASWEWKEAAWAEGNRASLAEKRVEELQEKVSRLLWQLDAERDRANSLQARHGF